jgi:hypothetical protein
MATFKPILMIDSGKPFLAKAAIYAFHNDEQIYNLDMSLTRNSAKYMHGKETCPTR